MILPEIEPIINVGIVCSSAATLHPKGDWKCIALPQGTLMQSLSPDSFMEIEGVTLGKDFHWQHNRRITYKGDFLTLNRPDSEGFRIVNRVPLEEYVASVVASEMSSSAPQEFIRAHAIIARTWALRKICGILPSTAGAQRTPSLSVSWQESDCHTAFHVCSDDHCQRYQGIHPDEVATRDCVRSTHGLILTDSLDGAPADTRFSKCCGGRTELFSSCWADEDYPYLKSVDCGYCDPSRLPAADRDKITASILNDYDRSTNYFNWQTVAEDHTIIENLRRQYGVDIGEPSALTPLLCGPSGRISLLEIKGSSGSFTVGKELAIRRLLSPSHLYSSAFRAQRLPHGFLLNGHGWGHGVGLCQIGAAVMAAEGKSVGEILSHYFPGAILKQIY